MLLAAFIIGEPISGPAVQYAITVPGKSGVFVAFVSEFVISFVLMSIILIVSNRQSVAKYTGLFAGVLVALYIAIEAPLSGMSMNPARTLGSAFPAHLYTALWIYFTAPPLGMIFAAELYKHGTSNRVACAKLHHQNSRRCIFCGSPGEMSAA